MSAAKFGLNNLKVVVDLNHLQIDGNCEDIMPLGDLKAKWDAFGWHTLTCSGHDLEELYYALKEMETVKDKPCVLIAETVKGRGVSFMENDADWHSRKMTKAEGAQALEEVAQSYKEYGFDEKIEESILFLNAEELEKLRKGG